MIEKGELARTSITLTNRSAKALSLEFLPTCACLSATPASTELKGGASVSFALSFDSKDDEGKTSRFFVVKTEPPSSKPLYYSISGVVRADKPAPSVQGSAAPAAEASSSGLELNYYYTSGCRSCEEFLSAELPKLEASYGVRVVLHRRDLLDPAVYEELLAFASSIGADIRAVPALRLGSTLLQGDEEIRSRLPALLIARGGESAPAEQAQAHNATRVESKAAVTLSALPVMAAGLVDGVNPCAFTTLIFLLASLALAGRGRREILAIGALFTLGVFLTYLGVGLGLFAALRAAGAMVLVSTILRWALFTALLVFAGLSVYDYTRIRSGRPSEIILQLPTALKLRIHASIRTRAKTAALAGSSFVLGFLVSIFEFACTGQVYLPTLAYLAREKGSSGAILLLILYNLCFIAPLVAVFAASWFGVSSKRIASVFQRRMGAVKLGLAAVFLVLAALTLLG